MEIYLIRHTTPLTEKGQIYGRTDVALAESFAEEKDSIIEQLPAKCDAVFSSPSSRCTQLAKAIAVNYNLGTNTFRRFSDQAEVASCYTDEALYELNFGDWEGKTWDTVNRKDSEIWMNDFVHLAPPNGETMLEMEQRVIQFMERLIQQSYQTVCVVTHGGVIRILLARYSGIPLKDSFSIKVGMGEVFKLALSSSAP
jgi:alpha-ribazole phosphatase